MTHRTFISIILVAALAVTGLTSAPARAGNDDIAKWIAGAVALGIIGAAIAEDRKRDSAVTRYRGYDNQYRHNTRRTHKKHRYQNQRRLRHGALPARCHRAFPTQRGEVYGFSRRCLLNNYSQFNALPHKCAVKTRGYNGNRRVVYRQNCLARHGFGLAQSGYGVANKGRR